MVPCKVGITLIDSGLPDDVELTLNTGPPLSVISPKLRDTLSAFGSLEEITPQLYRVLGLQFLDGFRQIHFDRDTRLLTLTA